MNRYYDSQFKKNIVTIYPGEFFSGRGDEYISTVLGSCISVAIHDKALHIGGLNHFMLAYDGTGDREKESIAGRFGEYAMELLINDLLKKGASRKNFIAKVFGGSNILGTHQQKSNLQVGNTNIKFVFDYLRAEGIPVISSNTGGEKPRKIFYDPKSSKIWLKHIQKTIHSNEYINEKEKEYATKVREKEQNAGDIVWF